MNDNRKFSLAAYPLCWPDGWKRTPPTAKTHAHFGTRSQDAGRSYATKKRLTVFQAIERIIDQLSKMGIGRDDLIISTNMPTRLDGLPRSDALEPQDSGAAVYWRRGHSGAMKVMAIDQYSTVAGNLGAIAATLEAMRAIERHGGAEILERTFTGFAALPASTSSDWRAVLGFRANELVSQPVVERRFRELAAIHHPDRGGDAARFHALTVAREDARRELGEA